jgi:hypothetical protein
VEEYNGWSHAVISVTIGARDAQTAKHLREGVVGALMRGRERVSVPGGHAMIREAERTDEKQESNKPNGGDAQ